MQRFDQAAQEIEATGAPVVARAVQNAACALLPEMALEQLYHHSLEALTPILRGLGREKRLSPEELEDLRSDLQIKLLEDDYRVLRQWNRCSSIEDYLKKVTYNSWRDRIRGDKGYVRVSPIATRLGPPAPELEMLLGRQGLTLDEAYQVIKPRFPSLSLGETEEIAAKINPRRGRSFVSEDVVVRVPDPKLTGDKHLEQREKLVEKRKALGLLRQLLAELPKQDRMLLVHAHAEGVKLSHIARSLGIDQRPLYRRNEKLLTQLRTTLEEAGLRWENLREVLGIDGPPERAYWLAEQLGTPARELEVLLTRQGLTFDEAYQAIKPRFPDLSRSEAEKIAAQIAHKPGRRFQIDGPMSVLLVHALDMIFHIARSSGIHQRPLDRCKERLLMRLRTALEEARLYLESLREVLAIDEPRERENQLVHGEKDKVRVFAAAKRLIPSVLKFARLLKWQGLTFKEAYRAIPAQDRMVLGRARVERVTFAHIASTLGIDQQPLFWRNESLLTQLRTTLEKAVLRWQDLGIEEPPEGKYRMIQEPTLGTRAPGVTSTDLAAFLKGTLPRGERYRMVRHLNHCPDCFDRYTREARLLEAIEKEEV